MSSSGQAPNVSMDELLASIKSMIEGESNGSASPQPGAEEEAVMDLTKVVQPKPAPAELAAPADISEPSERRDPVDAVSTQMLPQASEPYRGLSPHDDPRQAEYAAPGAPAGIPQGHAPQQPQAPRPQAGQPEGMMGQAAERAATPQSQSLQTLVSREGVADDQAAAAEAQKHLAEAGSAKEAANQITDLLGTMNDELGFGGAMPKSEAPERAAQPAGAEFDPDGLLGNPAAGREEPGHAAAPHPAQQRSPEADARAAAEADAVQPLAQQKNIAPQEMNRGLGMGGAPQPGHPQHAGQPQGQLPQGMPPHQRPAGQPQAEGQPQAHAMNAMGQSPMGGMGQAPAAGMGQPHLPNQGIQPSGEMRAEPRHDPRRESEYAMGQALSQADASLSVGQVGQAPGQHPFAGAEAQMRGLSQHHGVPGGQISGQTPAQIPGPGGGQLPAVSNGDGLPVLSAGRGVVPAAAPMMASPEPYADQLPLEMRNNLEEIVKQLLKPLLREWLERNLPDLLRGAVDESGKIDPNRL